MAEEIQLERLQIMQIDYKLMIRFHTGIPVSLITPRYPQALERSSLPASLLRGHLRAALIAAANTVADDLIRVCEASLENTGSSPQCFGDERADFCIACRLFGSSFLPSSLIVTSATLAPGQTVKTHQRSRGAVSLRAGLPVDPGQNLEATQPGLMFEARVYGTAALTHDECRLLKGSMRSIVNLGWGAGYGLSYCVVSVVDDRPAAIGG